MATLFRLRIRRCFVLFLVVAFGQLATSGESATQPQWLAVDVEVVTGAVPGPRLSRSVTLSAPQSATLRLAADYCRVQVVVNGRAGAQIEEYCPTQLLDLTDLLVSGENRFDFLVEPIDSSPAKIAATITVRHADSSEQVVSTDDQWTLRLADQVQPTRTLGLVPPEIWGLERRSIAVDPFENYEQWQQARGGGTAPRFFLAPGFEITELCRAQPEEGSWISVACDEQGRLVIAREDHGFLRITLDDEAHSVLSREPIDSDLLECRGLASRDGWFFASANNSKRLVRFRIDAQGQVTDLTRLREFAGGVGHGRNDIALDQDSLWIICGDSVDPPTAEIEDHTSPLRTRVAGSFSREGSLLRTDLNGRHWELHSAGLRNPYGIARHPELGDLFTYDADNEYDLGMPWYRPTRILQLLPGGDYGYREATGQIPPRFADQVDAAPPLLDIGRGSPTAVAFGHAFRFPSPYRRALFVLDWTYGRVLAVHLYPCGGTYRAATELFLQGKPLNVTDVVAGRDGAMYLVTGGRQTQSALYRVSATTPPPESEPELDATEFTWSQANQSEASRRDFAHRTRELVRNQRARAHKLASSAHGKTPKEAPHNEVREDDTLTDDELVLSLMDPDPAVRHAAQLALERSSSDRWPLVAVAPCVAICPPRGILAVARKLDPGLLPRVLGTVQEIPPRDVPLSIRLVLLRIIELCLATDRDAVLKVRQQLERNLWQGWEAAGEPRWQISVEGTGADYRRRAALILAQLESTRLPELAARDLLASPVQEDQIAGLMALRGQLLGWTPDSRELQLETLAAMPQLTGGEGLPVFHAWLERETLAGLTPAELARYAALKVAASEPEPLLPTGPVVQKWKLEDLEPVADDATRGDAGRGADLFRAALCARCHRVGQRGPNIGPDLSYVAGRFSRRDILDSILNPSKSVAANYRAVTIETVDGRILTGRVLPGGDFRSETIRLVPDALHPDQIVEIDKKKIETHRPAEHSPMPTGLLDTFSPNQIADLLAFLTR